MDITYAYQPGSDQVQSVQINPSGDTIHNVVIYYRPDDYGTNADPGRTTEIYATANDGEQVGGFFDEEVSGDNAGGVAFNQQDQITGQTIWEAVKVRGC